MAVLIFISHPEVVVDPAVPVPDWGLSAAGRNRAIRFARSKTLSGVGAIWSSTERKAVQTASHLADWLGHQVQTDARLGENDRTATGFLAPHEFEAAADAFFANPDASFQGWERAIDAQCRIEYATRAITARHKLGDLAIVSHGAVGTLLFCALSGLPINRVYDQPHQGHYFAVSLRNFKPLHGWKPLN